MDNWVCFYVNSKASRGTIVADKSKIGGVLSGNVLSARCRNSHNEIQ